jgi:hypothetical protein
VLCGLWGMTVVFSGQTFLYKQSKVSRSILWLRNQYPVLHFSGHFHCASSCRSCRACAGILIHSLSLWDKLVMYNSVRVKKQCPEHSESLADWTHHY